ncbi:acetyl-CoA C-acyltransferase [Phytoactinopolyspora sp. XMNu-373]|uniref:Probable acetyl-CoA acetyltransferase n=2 Tax=Phytoactinopolyspora mesophila TaxID=2650750 RepID=A0A7K3M7W3_9ACTN|nr:acetyl-CoA C-acyltransferase [Phytoactinopolyspora mesophila]
MDRRALILDAVRTPFGRLRGGLSAIRVDDLAALPLAELVRRRPELDPAEIADVVYGDTNGAGEDNRDVARMAVLLAGLPASVPGVTVNRLCASGGEAVVQVARAIRAGDMDLAVAGGVEGMSRAPYVLPKPDDALPRSMELHQTTVGWRLVNPAFPDTWTRPLGEAAERVATGLGIGRREMDDWALRSHTLAHQAWEKGLHQDYVHAVSVPDGSVVERDESIRPGSTAESLAALKPAFTAAGTVTAGNSSPVNDGAIAILMGTPSAATRLRVEPVGEVLASSAVGVEPDRWSLAPVPAIERALGRAGIAYDDVAVWEINEAFAAMVLSVLHEEPRIDRDRVNPNGGAIAIGHPLGASMPRVIVDCVRELRRRGGGIGVAAACIGVGQGLAAVVRV